MEIVVRAAEPAPLGSTLGRPVRSHRTRTPRARVLTLALVVALALTQTGWLYLLRDTIGMEPGPSVTVLPAPPPLPLTPSATSVGPTRAAPSATSTSGSRPSPNRTTSRPSASSPPSSVPSAPVPIRTKPQSVPDDDSPSLGSEVLVSQGCPVNASSTATGKATAVVDGKASTTWVSKSGDDQWLHLDLRDEHRLGSLRLHWKHGARSYQVLVAGKSGVWSVVYSTDASTGGLERITLPKDTVGRYLKLVLRKPVSAAGYALGEVEVNGRSTNNGN